MLVIFLGNGAEPHFPIMYLLTVGYFWIPWLQSTQERLLCYQIFFTDVMSNFHTKIWTRTALMKITMFASCNLSFAAVPCSWYIELIQIVFHRPLNSILLHRGRARFYVEHSRWILCCPRVLLQSRALVPWELETCASLFRRCTQRPSELIQWAWTILLWSRRSPTS